MRSTLRTLGIISLAAASMAACEDNLEVKNLNNPDLGRVYAVPGGVEGVISTLYRTFHQNVKAGEGLDAQSKVMALESYGQVANLGMALRGGIPRVGIINQRGNQVSTGNNANFSSLSRVMRTAATVAQAVDAYTARGATLGNKPRDMRARSFAYFVNGIAMGHLALGYDSVAIATPQTPTTAIPEFITPGVAMAEALKILDSAQAIITDTAVFTYADAAIPGEWVGSTTALSAADYVRLIRSYKARLRAGVARTPAGRADSVAWAQVAADAAAGLTADHRISLNPTTGWSAANDANSFMTSQSFHQISLMYIGMADTSGAYQTYIARPLAQRFGDSVLVRTPDIRWPQGATRAAQTASSTLPLGATRYISNRDPGRDQQDQSNPWGTSQYDHRRWWAIATNNNVGVYTFMSRQEIAMLNAEALIRTGNAAGAMTIVNASRTANNLLAFTDPAGVAPGGNGCVPKLPTGVCASLLEAMKYEKRMETQMTGYMQWFVDSRGWGDLVTGTSLHWPVPFQEMDTRNIPFYNMPATGTLPGAATGTYGF